MKITLLKLFIVTFLLALSLDGVALAQQKNPCPKNGKQEIWIKRKKENGYLEGDGRRFVEIRDGVLFYCVKDYVVQEDLNGVEAIRFEKAKSDSSKPASSSGKSNDASTVIPDHSATVRVLISSPTEFIHPTLSGYIALLAVFNENGTVSDIEVIDSSEAELNDIARAKAKELKFTPAIKGGSFVNARKTVVMTFLAESSAANSAGSANAGTPSGKSALTNTSVRPRTASITPIKLLKPDNGLPVAKGPTTLQWEPVSDAYTYKIQVQCYYSYEACHSERLSASQTTYSMKFLGEGPIRWRVIAERKNGSDVQSEWWYFGYKK